MIKLFSAIITGVGAICASYKIGVHHSNSSQLPSMIDIELLQKANPDVEIKIIPSDITQNVPNSLNMPSPKSNSFFDSILFELDTFISKYKFLETFLNSGYLLFERINNKIKEIIIDICQNILPEEYYIYIKFLFWGIIFYILIKIIIFCISFIRFELKLIYTFSIKVFHFLKSLIPKSKQLDQNNMKYITILKKRKNKKI